MSRSETNGQGAKANIIIPPRHGQVYRPTDNQFIAFPGHYLEVTGFDNSNISRYPIAELNLNDVTDDQIFGTQRQLLTLAQHSSELGYHVLERFHNLGTFRFLQEKALEC